MQKGNIGVTTENIFPVIKKFLYSDHEIFLREMVSNAVDATQKMKTLADKGDFKGELGDLTVRVSLDEKAKTLTFSDHGIGMTAEEIDKYINQIAFSGVTDFLDKYKDSANAIIGHFGLGFYSAFMVSEKVEIVTKSHQEGAQAVRWTCDGSPEFTIDDAEKDGRGTDIILHIADDCKEFLEKQKIQDLLNKYCKFMAVPIAFGKKQEWSSDEKKMVETQEDNIINDVEPLWTKAPSTLKDEDYKSFYRTLYPMQMDEPLFWIHLNVDFPFNLTGILYFPRIQSNIDLQKNKIQLYCNQVFVTDQVEGIVPEFLTLLHGVIDSPDIPLNVSRSFLQSDQNVKKISTYITKKVAEKLEELFKKDREAYEKNWDDIRVFIEYGMISDPKFYERAEKFFLFKDTDDKYYTIAEYKELIKENQTNKDNMLVYLYATDKDDQYANIEAAKAKGYNVLMMDGMLDAHFISAYEQKVGEKGNDSRAMFARVDSNPIDQLIVRDDTVADSKLDDTQKETLKAAFEKVIDKVKFNVEFTNAAETDAPVEVTQNEWMRRMKEMEMMGGGPMSFYGSMPDSYTLMLNTNSPVIVGLLDKDEVEQEATIRQIYDLAQLSKNLLKGKDLSEFVKRNMEKL